MVSIPGQETASSSSTAREPRVTLVMVAAKAGVSKSTAGYVLTGQDQRMRISEQTRHKVLRAAAEMNYRPNVMARSLRTVVTRPIAIVSDTLATEAYGGELIEGCLSAAASHGRLTFIGETRRDPELQAALIEEFLAEQVSDFVFASVYPREVAVPAALARSRVVMLNCAATDPAVPAVLPTTNDKPDASLPNTCSSEALQTGSGCLATGPPMPTLPDATVKPGCERHCGRPTGSWPR